MNSRNFNLAAMLLLGSVLLVSCSDKAPTASARPTSSDRDKFVGRWAGSYVCPGISLPAVADTLIIALGPGALDFRITLHVGTFNPDVVTGELSAPDVINVPEQTMGGAPGTARITYTNGRLTYAQSGLGITCGGSDYLKVA